MIQSLDDNSRMLSRRRKNAGQGIEKHQQFLCQSRPPLVVSETSVRRSSPERRRRRGRSSCNNNSKIISKLQSFHRHPLSSLVILATFTLSAIVVTAADSNVPRIVGEEDNWKSLTPPNDSQRKSYHGFSLYHLMPDTEEQVAFLNELIDEEAGTGKMDVWKGPTKANRSVDIVISPAYQAPFNQSLHNISLDFRIGIEDLEKEISKEREEVEGLTGRMVDSLVEGSSSIHGLNQSSIMEAWGRVMRDSVSSFSFRKYHRFRPMMDFLTDLEAQNRHVLRLTTIGRTHERRPLVVAQLVQGYNRERNIKNLVDDVNWYFLPVMNPDGYEESHTRDRFWRKNKRPRSCSSSRCCESGVDLNRNFDWHHCELGSSTKPCRETYCGPFPFSEPEAAAVKNYILNLKKNRNLQAYLSFHSYSQLWLFPYGHKKSTYARNLAELVGSVLLAFASDETAGGSDDWAKGKANIRFVYLIELRPCEDCTAGFILPRNQIEPTAFETFEAIRVIGEEVLKRFTAPTRTTRRVTRRCREDWQCKVMIKQKRNGCRDRRARRKCPITCKVKPCGRQN